MASISENLKNNRQHAPCQQGKIAEYAVLLGFLALLSIASLQGLGISIFKLPHSTAKTMETHSTLSVLGVNPVFAKGPAVPSMPLNGNTVANGYYKVVTDSATGVPSLQMVDTNREGSNVTSVDGNQRNSLGSMRLAEYLDTLAEEETDEEKQAYYAKMAKLAYYMGANEAEIDDFDTYGLQSVYSNGDALQDLMMQQAELQQLMLNPPPGVDPNELVDVLPIVSEVFNIAQSYQTLFAAFVGPDGKVTSNFSTISNGTYAKGLGSAMREGTTSRVATANFPLRETTYAALVPYEKLKTQVKTTLSQNKLPETPAVTTFQDAVVVDTAATN